MKTINHPRRVAGQTAFWAAAAGLLLSALMVLLSNTESPLGREVHIARPFPTAGANSAPAAVQPARAAPTMPDELTNDDEGELDPETAVKVAENLLDEAEVHVKKAENLLDAGHPEAKHELITAREKTLMARQATMHAVVGISARAERINNYVARLLARFYP